MSITAIIQARMGSSRLGGKVLMKINGSSILECLLKQISFSKLLDDIIIATTLNKEDDEIFYFAKKNGIKIFRGSEKDVLDRYYQCSKQFSLTHIARITADNPLIDPTIIDKVITLYKNNRYDYVNNFLERTFPVGTECEVFSFESLEKTWREAKNKTDREHVTSFIYKNPKKFSIGCLKNKKNLSHLHWTVNRIEDLNLVKAIYAKISNLPVQLKDILKILDEDPALIEINKNIDPHQGYLKSFKEDD